MVFLNFVAAHRPGGLVEGVVDEFTSHGAFVNVGEARCYLPLSGMGDPPPRAARDVVKKGETRTFTVQALDPSRRGVELALPEFAHVSGTPSDETVEAEIKADRRSGRAEKSAAATKKAPAKKAPAKKAPAKKAPVKKAANTTSKKAAAAAPKKAAPKKAAAKVAKSPAKKAVTTKSPARKAASKKSPAKEAPAKKAATKKAAPKAATKKAPAVKRTGRAAKSAG